MPVSSGRPKSMASPSVGYQRRYSNTSSTNTQHLVHDSSCDEQFEVKRSQSRFVSSLVLFCALLFGLSSVAQAGEFCSTFPDPANPGDGLIDGDDPVTVQFFIDNNVTQITVDTNCTFRNWDPLSVTINFQTPGTGLKPIYLIVFDNVDYTGNMACGNVDHKFWVVNSPVDPFSFKCQDLFIPVEAIQKSVAAGKTTVGIGETFTYTLTIPVLYDPATGTVLDGSGTAVAIGNVILTDDLNALGVDVSLLGTPTVTWVTGSNSGPVAHTFNNAAGILTFDLTPAGTVPAFHQIEIEMTLQLNDNPGVNIIGTPFFNTASWTFSRSILLDPDGDGIEEPVFFDPLPGENGVSEVLTIGAPELTVTKTSPDVALNIGVPGSFTIDVQNTGNTDAWSPTIVDVLPDVSFPDPSGPDLVAGMCDAIPSNIDVGLYQADGTTVVGGPLILGDDYTLTFDNSTTPPDDCTLTIEVDSTGSSSVVIAPGQRLIISYNAQLDGDTDADGEDLTNVAAATLWYTADPAGADTFTYNPGIDGADPGTPAVIDNQDTHTVTTGLSGYFFTKTVENRTTGQFPATTAASGDTLRYTLRVFNATENITGITVTDDLTSASFLPGTFTEITGLNQGVTGTPDFTGGILTVESQDLTALGDEFVYVFEIQLAGGLSNGDVISNQASLDASGVIDGVPADANAVAYSDNPFINGIDDPLINPPDPESTDIIILQPGPLAKTDGPASAVIGETFSYTITVPQTPVATPLYDVRILDSLGVDSLGTSDVADISFVSATATGGSWTLSTSGAGTVADPLVIEDVAAGIDIPAGGQAVVTVTVQLANTTTNQAGLQFYNTASYTFNRTNGVASPVVGGGVTTTSATTVFEPGIVTFTKVADNTTPTTGDTVHYTITLQADSGANVSDVFDVVFADSLDLGLAYVDNSSTVSAGAGVGAGNTVISTDVTGDGVSTAQTLVWGVSNVDIDIQAGDTITFEYDVLVLDSVLANQVLNNSIVALWTSIDGAAAGERSGDDGIGGLNDYFLGPVVETLTTPDINTSITKVRSDDTFDSTDIDVRIGDVVEYTLTIPVPEGTLGNLQLVDTLPTGLEFVDVVSVNYDTTAVDNYDPPLSPNPGSNFSYATIAAASLPAAGDTGALNWDLGDIANPANDGNLDNFIIIYRARVQNNGVLAQAASTPLSNTVSMSYEKSATTVSGITDSADITVLQPDLSVTKSASPANGDIFIDASEVITYTVDIINSGTAPAYDTVLQDVIPAGLRTAGVTTTSITRHTTSTDALVATLTPFNPNYVALTGDAGWDFDSGVDDEYTIPVGETLRVVYEVTADAGIAQGLILTNQASVTVYYSFDDEGIPTGSVAGDREDYGPTATASTTLYTASPPTKALITPAPGTPEVTIGEQVIYQITVPGTVSASTLYDVNISDVLNSNLLHLTADTTIVGGTGVTDNSNATQLDVDIDEIAAGTQVVIELHTRLSNVLAAQQGVDIDNTVSYSYAFTDGGSAQPAIDSTDIVTVNIVEPNIGAISKTADNLTPTAGETVRFSVQLAATGGTDNSNVYDVTLTDTMDLGLIYQGNPTVTTGAGDSADNSIAAPVITVDGTTGEQTLVWSLASGTDIDIVEGTAVTIEFDAVLDSSVLSGQMLQNRVTAQWTGIDGASTFERDGSDGSGGLNDYITAEATVTLNLPGINTTIDKVRSNDTYYAGDNNVRIGEIVEYTVTIPMPEGTLVDLQIIDTLPQGVQFEGIASINGNTGPAPFSAVAPFSHSDISVPIPAGDPTTGTTTVTWNLGNVTNLPEDNAPNDFAIIYRARVLDNVFAQANITPPINNTITMTYETAGGTVTSSDLTTSIALFQPDLSLVKSAAPDGGDTVIEAGEGITYTLDITNNGTAPAYDPVIEDVIPAGLRSAGVTTTVITLLGPAENPPEFNPNFVAGTGVATWNFDDGATADTYTINPNQTLHVEYRVVADADLASGLTLTNLAEASLYYSFDDDDAPNVAGIVTVAEEYGPSPSDSVVLTSPTPGALLKQSPFELTANPDDQLVTIGDTFTYRITVPSATINVALNDVRVTDDLSFAAIGADLGLVSFVASGTFSGTPVNTGSASNIVIEDATNGIDIPANGQLILDITVEVLDTGNNVAGNSFSNIANWTYNQLPNTPASQQAGTGDTSGPMTIIAPDTLTLTKSGPGSMRVGVPGDFRLNIHNDNTSGNAAPAWDITITDQLPDLAPGGMCDTAPDTFVAGIYLSDAVTLVTPLTQGVDYDVVFDSPSCLLTITMTSVDAALPEDNRLIIDYRAYLDADTSPSSSLTNIAGVTEWFSNDTAGAGATGSTRTFTRTLSTDPAIAQATLDFEDAVTVSSEAPVISFEKTVANITTGLSGDAASPGDTLRYRVTIENVSPIDLPVFSFIDDLGALNASSVFTTGSLSMVTVPGGAVDNSNAGAGTNAAGLVTLDNLSLGIQGSPTDTVVIEFDVVLQPVITSGTVVLNQGQITAPGVNQLSNDPVVNPAELPAIIGDEVPTETTITSAPAFQVEKTSADITDDPAVLVQGDTLRYTITVKNIGQENAINTLLTDQIPANTTYVADSVTLNGLPVGQPDGGVSPLITGIAINAPENTTAGYLRADTDVAADNVATITFDVVINASAIDGTVISNQGFVSGEGAGSGAFPQQPSDDPDTALADDPTLDVVGSVALLDVLKTVVIQNDLNSDGSVNAGDTLRYTVTIRNIGSAPATDVVLLDELGALNTPAAFVAGSLNIISVTAGADASNTDVNGGTNGTGLLDVRIAGLDAADTMEIVFDVVVNGAVVAGNIISNQAFVSSNGLPTEPSDADGIDANGDQPTIVVVGNVPQLSITKQVLVVGGGATAAGGELEYVVRITNIGSIVATNAVITDILDPVNMTYLNGTGLLNGLPITDPAANTVTVNAGDLAIAGVAELRFRVTLSNALIIGTTVSNTASVDWDLAPLPESATVTIDIGGSPGSATLSGQVWHDANFDNVADSSETLLEGWTVDLYRNSVLLASTVSDANGVYQFTGVVANITPGLPDGDPYDIRFIAPGAVATTATLGDGSSIDSNTVVPFTDGPQSIRDILATTGGNVTNLNMPRQPNGIVYDAVLRLPVPGVQLTMINQTRSNRVVPATCFDDQAQQNQVTLADGYYKFDLNFSNSGCVSGDEYVIQIQPPANGFIGTTSVIIPPVEPVNGVALDVPNCLTGGNDQVPTTTQYCETSASALQPDPSIAPGDAGSEYYLKFLFDNADFTNQVFNNHIPVDPEQEEAVAISKVAGKLNVVRSDLVPYTITVNNTLPVPLYDLNVIDNFPAGFKYVDGSARVDGVEVEPLINGRELAWQNISLAVNEKRVIKLLLIVGSGVGEGEYVNTARVINSQTNTAFSGVATATVRVIPDPTFDCTDIIGKVFDDKNLNSYQDQGEKGLPGVQVATARGLRVTTDSNGRFHITCAIVANEVRGSNFIMKLDEQTLPSGYRVTTENPRVQRATRGKMLKFNFGTAIHRVVRLDLADGVFEKGSTELRPQWRSRIETLIIELQKEGSILRLSYLAENETEDEVDDRLDAIEDLVSDRWDDLDCCYKLTIETEVFWRKGSPSAGREFAE